MLRFTKRKPETVGNVTALLPSDHLFLIQGVRLVPVRYTVCVSAHDAEAACRLASEIAVKAPESGFVDFQSGSEIRALNVSQASPDSGFETATVPLQYRVTETMLSCVKWWGAA